MNKYIITALLAGTFVSAKAQCDTLAVGYCNGKTATATEHRLDGKGWNSAALCLSEEALSAYQGNNITGIRAGFVNVLNTDTVTVWLRSEKDGANLAEATVVRKTGTKNIAKGWNKILFNKPYAITGEEGTLYAGYSIRQKASSDIVSIVAPKRIGTSYIKQGEKAWQDVSSEGVLSIEALVAGENMPDFDLGIGSAMVKPRPSVSPTALQLELGVHNYGTKDVKGFTLELRSGDTWKVNSHVDASLLSLADTTLTLIIDPQKATNNNTAMTVTLLSLDNATDCNSKNNTTIPYYTYTRNVILEEFTTEQCTACPTAAANIHTLLEDERFVGSVIAVAHHVGYYTDGFTLGYNAENKTYEEEELLSFYNNGTDVYAPGGMLNRKPYFTSKSNKPTPVFVLTNYATLEAYTLHETELTTNAMLSIDLKKAADGSKVDVHVGGICNELYASKNPYIQVYLIENNIRSTNQSGASGTYYQQHVTRDCNGIWGEPITWHDNAFSYDCSFAINRECNTKNMEVVAFIYNYDNEDLKNCAIENGVSIQLDAETGIDEVAIDNGAHEIARYGIDGSKATASSKGIAIVKLSDGRTVKIIR